MKSVSGLGKESRKQLTKVLRGTTGTISVAQAASILNLPSIKAAKLLWGWNEQGWVSRVMRGVYVPVPLNAESPDVSLEDPWIIAEKLFSPCYIGGWSAAEHWGLTEQIFRTVVVLTTRKPRNRSPKIKGTDFLLRTISPKAMFGLNPVWRGQVKVAVSDPARTIVDMLDNPQLGGGMRTVVDILRNYLKSETEDSARLIGYAKRLGNSAVFKRLGFLLESVAPEEAEAIKTCLLNMKTGKVKFDPDLQSERLVTRWKLWVPKNWKQAKK
ncbi:MAG: hypothetical protein HY787_19175 [Deltaproteobacteria bacterium]|nr:hypothetical protein [Deltaproteobacteria bacterium]